jgi:hypothetical protein
MRAWAPAVSACTGPPAADCSALLCCAGQHGPKQGCAVRGARRRRRPPVQQPALGRPGAGAGAGPPQPGGARQLIRCTRWPARMAAAANAASAAGCAGRTCSRRSALVQAATFIVGAVAAWKQWCDCCVRRQAADAFLGLGRVCSSACQLQSVGRMCLLAWVYQWHRSQQSNRARRDWLCVFLCSTLQASLDSSGGSVFWVLML